LTNNFVEHTKFYQKALEKRAMAMGPTPT